MEDATRTTAAVGEVKRPPEVTQKLWAFFHYRKLQKDATLWCFHAGGSMKNVPLMFSIQFSSMIHSHFNHKWGYLQQARNDGWLMILLTNVWGTIAIY